MTITPNHIRTLRGEVAEAATALMSLARPLPHGEGVWNLAFLNDQFDLVIQTAPRLPGVELHDSVCEFASAYCRLVLAGATEREKEFDFRFWTVTACFCNEDFYCYDCRQGDRDRKEVNHYGADYIYGAAQEAQDRGASQSEIDFILRALDA